MYPRSFHHPGRWSSPHHLSCYTQGTFCYDNKHHSKQKAIWSSHSFVYKPPKLLCFQTTILTPLLGKTSPLRNFPDFLSTNPALLLVTCCFPNILCSFIFLHTLFSFSDAPSQLLWSINSCKCFETHLNVTFMEEIFHPGYSTCTLFLCWPNVRRISIWWLNVSSH